MEASQYNIELNIGKKVYQKIEIFIFASLMVSLYFTACSDNCTGPDVNGSYACSEPSSDDEDENGDVIDISSIFDDEECEDVSYDSPCEPGSDTPGTLDLKLGSADEFPLLSLEIFLGNVQSGERLAVYTGPFIPSSVHVLAYHAQRVSARAVYQAQGEEIVAIDGAILFVEDHEFCSGKCTEGGHVSLDLFLQSLPRKISKH